MAICGVYFVKSLRTGNLYVGASTSVTSRWKEHVNCLRTGTHHCKDLQKEWNEYGLTNFVFQVQAEVPKATLYEEELKQIHLLNPKGVLLNSKRVGGGTRNKSEHWLKGDPRMGQANHFTKLTEEKVISILERYKAGEGSNSIAKDLKLHKATIQNIVRRRCWRHLGYLELAEKQNGPRGLGAFTADHVLAIRKRISSGIALTVIAKEFGVTAETIGEIKAGRTYKWVEDV